MLAGEAAPQDLRERRKQQTRTTLVRLARKFTHEHGLAGFTLEELCEAAGISRRTFFNHFASKDDAVLGIPKNSPFEPHQEQFLASKGTLTLVEALADLTANAIDTMVRGETSPENLMAVIHREPSLLNRMRQNGLRAGEEIERLICEREGLQFPNHYAHTVSFVLHHLTMASLTPPAACETDLIEFPKQAHDRETFLEILATRLGHLRDLLNEPNSEKAPVASGEVGTGCAKRREVETPDDTRGPTSGTAPNTTTNTAGMSTTD